MMHPSLLHRSRGAKEIIMAKQKKPSFFSKLFSSFSLKKSYENNKIQKLFKKHHFSTEGLSDEVRASILKGPDSEKLLQNAIDILKITHPDGYHASDLDDLNKHGNFKDHVEALIIIKNSTPNITGEQLTKIKLPSNNPIEFANKIQSTKFNTKPELFKCFIDAPNQHALIDVFNKADFWDIYNYPQLLQPLSQNKDPEHFFRSVRFLSYFKKVSPEVIELLQRTDIDSKELLDTLGILSNQKVLTENNILNIIKTLQTPHTAKDINIALGMAILNPERSPEEPFYAKLPEYVNTDIFKNALTQASDPLSLAGKIKNRILRENEPLTSKRLESIIKDDNRPILSALPAGPAIVPSYTTSKKPSEAEQSGPQVTPPTDTTKHTPK